MDKKENIRQVFERTKNMPIREGGLAIMLNSIVDKLEELEQKINELIKLKNGLLVKDKIE